MVILEGCKESDIYGTEARATRVHNEYSLQDQNSDFYLHQIIDEMVVEKVLFD